MIINNIAIVRTLNRSIWLKLKANKLVKTILCNKVIGINLDIDKEIISTRRFKVEGGWYSYKKNKTSLSTFPLSFTLNGKVNYKEAFLKLLYWSNSEAGQLMIGAKTLNLSLSDKQQESLLYPSHPIKAFVKIVFLSLRFWVKKTHEMDVVELLKDKIVFAIYSEADLILWKHLVRLFSVNEVVLLGLPGNKVGNNLQMFCDEGYRYFNANELPQLYNYKTKIICSRDRAKMNIQLAIVNNLKTINSYIGVAKLLINSGCKSLVVNAGENRFESHILEAEFQAADRYVFNTMNGVKYNTANNAGVKFTKWFIHDEPTKKVLLDVGVSENQLCVAGHLMEDEAALYVFSNSLKKDISFYNQKKVLFVCTSPSALAERLELINSLSKFVEKGFYVLWKDHPSITEDIPKLEGVEVLSNKFNKHVLYDAFLVSDYLIVSGSTVALEAQWFNLPSVTFEMGETMLYLVKENKVPHVKTIDELNNVLLSVDIRVNQKKSYTTSNVAKRYKEVISGYK